MTTVYALLFGVNEFQGRSTAPVNVLVAAIDDVQGSAGGGVPLSPHHVTTAPGPSASEDRPH